MEYRHSGLPSSSDLGGPWAARGDEAVGRLVALCEELSSVEEQAQVQKEKPGVADIKGTGRGDVVHISATDG